MSDFENFVKDRHKAFADVLYKDDLTELKKYAKKYGMKYPKGENAEKIAKAGVYKAIPHCTDFSEEDKDMAFKKCLELGFNPIMRF